MCGWGCVWVCWVRGVHSVIPRGGAHHPLHVEETRVFYSCDHARLTCKGKKAWREKQIHAACNRSVWMRRKIDHQHESTYLVRMEIWLLNGLISTLRPCQSGMVKKHHNIWTSRPIWPIFAQLRTPTLTLWCRLATYTYQVRSLCSQGVLLLHTFPRKFRRIFHNIIIELLHEMMMMKWWCWTPPLIQDWLLLLNILLAVYRNIIYIFIYAGGHNQQLKKDALLFFKN